MKITMEDIARMAGVSKATVSRVLNDKPNGVGRETRDRVKKIIEQTGYCPDSLGRGIVTPRTWTIGVLIPDIMNPFFAGLVKAVETYAQQNGYTVVFGNTDSSPEKEQCYLTTLIAKKVDGIMLTPSSDNSAVLGKKLKKHNVPYVLLDRSIHRISNGFGVYVDNKYASYIACSYLIQHGDRRIAHITGQPGVSTSRERLEGYSAAIEQFDIPYDASLIRNGDYTMEGGYNAVLEMHKEGLSFDAIIAANDVMAIGALKALNECGYEVPRDIEVIGFDNIQFTNMTNPPLTTIQIPVDEMGRRAMDILLSLINGEIPKEKRIHLKPELIVRMTTRAEKM